MNLEKLENIVRKAAKPIAITALAGIIAFSSLSCVTQATPPPDYTPPPITTPTPTQPIPTIDIISKEEFKEYFNKLISMVEFEPTINNNKLLNDVNNYVYQRLTGKNPATYVTSIVVSKEDYEWYIEKYYPTYSGFAYGITEKANWIKSRPLALEMLERYGFSKDTPAKYVAIGQTTGRGYLNFNRTNHEIGHSLDKIYWEQRRHEFEDDSFETGFRESVAYVYVAASGRLAQRECPEVNFLVHGGNTSELEILINDITSSKESGIYHRSNVTKILPWLAVLNDDNLSHLASVLREEWILDPQSTMELYQYLTDMPMSERGNYTKKLITSAEPSQLTEINEISTSRLKYVIPSDPKNGSRSVWASKFMP